MKIAETTGLTCHYILYNKGNLSRGKKLTKPTCRRSTVEGLLLLVFCFATSEGYLMPKTCSKKVSRPMSKEILAITV